MCTMYNMVSVAMLICLLCVAVKDDLPDHVCDDSVCAIDPNVSVSVLCFDCSRIAEIRGCVFPCVALCCSL